MYYFMLIILNVCVIILQQKDRDNDEQEGGRCTKTSPKHTRDAGGNAEGGS